MFETYDAPGVVTEGSIDGSSAQSSPMIASENGPPQQSTRCGSTSESSLCSVGRRVLELGKFSSSFSFRVGIRVRARGRDRLGEKGWG